MIETPLKYKYEVIQTQKINNFTHYLIGFDHHLRAHKYVTPTFRMVDHSCSKTLPHPLRLVICSHPYLHA